MAVLAEDLRDARDSLPLHNKDDIYFNREKTIFHDLVDRGPNRILDLGCGAGQLGRRLLELGKAESVVGVEIFPEAAEKARQVYAEVHVGDIETMNLAFANFDYIICGDVLEHLRDPYRIVRLFHGWLKNAGVIICTVPNIRNFRVMAALLFHGQWEYEDSGILDRTHLRFFTYSSAQELFSDAGFTVIDARPIIYGPKKTGFNKLTFGLFSGFLATQTLVVSRKNS